MHNCRLCLHPKQCDCLCTVCVAARVPRCACGMELDTELEIAHLMCDGCAIDLYERQQAAREQRWLEDDRNWA
jgi:hypothetical protein